MPWLTLRNASEKMPAEDEPAVMGVSETLQIMPRSDEGRSIVKRMNIPEIEVPSAGNGLLLPGGAAVSGPEHRAPRTGGPADLIAHGANPPQA